MGACKIFIYFSLSLLVSEIHVAARKEEECVIAPEECPNINVTFLLYSKEAPNSPEEIDYKNPFSLTASRFDFDLPTKIIIHGYTGNKTFTPNPELREAYFNKSETPNIITVDYGPLVRLPCAYTTAVRNSKVVANCTARFIDYMVLQGVDLNTIHVIGFSLGAQISGKISRHLKSGKIERITGLDPAGPMFYKSVPQESLDRKDAKFIDIIHTNIGMYGIVGAVGHLDFYPNGGDYQPGCKNSTRGEQISCNHKRAVLLYAESINNPEAFPSISCPNFPTFVSGACNSRYKQLLYMGEYVNQNATGVYYMMTNDEYPFSKGEDGIVYRGGTVKNAVTSFGTAIKNKLKPNFFN